MDEDLIRRIKQELKQELKQEFEQKVEEQKQELKQEFEQKVEEQKQELKQEFEQKVEEQKQEFEQKVEEQTQELKQEFEQKLEQQKQELEIVKSIVDSTLDPRLACWNRETSTRGTASSSIRTLRQRLITGIGYCMCCGASRGSPFNLTTAHIVSNINQINSLFGSDNSYVDDITIESVKNYLVLCGTEGECGSCHDGYDKLKFSMYFNKDTGNYQWIQADGSIMLTATDNRRFHPLTLTPAVIGDKYIRLLNWRTLRIFLQPGITSVWSPGERRDWINNLKNWEEDECTD